MIKSYKMTKLKADCEESKRIVKDYSSFVRHDESKINSLKKGIKKYKKEINREKKLIRKHCK